MCVQAYLLIFMMVDKKEQRAWMKFSFTMETVAMPPETFKEKALVWVKWVLNLKVYQTINEGHE